MSDLKPYEQRGPCPSCLGTGFQMVSSPDSCMTCKGDGTIPRAPRFTDAERQALGYMLAWQVECGDDDGAEHADTIRAMLDGEKEEG